MKLAAAVPVVAAALALAPAAAALIPLQAGDQLLVYSTRIACTSEVTAGPVLHCYRGTKGGTPVVGSFQVSISRSSVSVERIGSKGQTSQIFRKAQPKLPNVRIARQSTRSATLFVYQHGDLPAALAGTNIFCVVPAVSPTGLFCDPAANTKLNATITGSYGFVINNKAITVTQATDPQGHSKAVFTKNF